MELGDLSKERIKHSTTPDWDTIDYVDKDEALRDLEALQAENAKLRKILANVNPREAIRAKEAAGYAVKLHLSEVG